MDIYSKHVVPVHQKLNQWYATAISGNDILSSALYVSGIAAMFAGVFAPLVLIGIAVVLFLYKAVYTEVVEALPINGGAYNCLLNGTSKTVAATAGVMTILSYIATAVISAKVGIEYLHTVVHTIPVIPATIGVLLLFAILVISGIRDSAKVALGIFILHIVTLVGFLGMGLLFFLKGNSYFLQNIANTGTIIASQGGIWNTLYLAFAASLLGVSGFESSANFVEEQERGVFRKTLRNMLIGVAIFNPLISLVTLNSMPLGSIVLAKDFLLADAAKVIGGSVFQYIVVIDAFLVLSGAVLTAFIGVSGLIFRMAADACLPEFLTKQNSKGSYPRIIISFFLLCSSILIVTKGNLLSLAGVYTIAFLGVMSFFAFGNLILKETRTELKRTYHAPFIFVVMALLATTMGILGNIRIDINNLTFFEMYFIPAFTLVLFIIYQDYVLKWAIRISKPIPFVHSYLSNRFSDLVEGKFVVFVRHISRLYHALDYINKNETGWNVTLVHCQCDSICGDNKEEHLAELHDSIVQLKKAGVFPHLNLDLKIIDKPFGAEVIQQLSEEMRLHKNRMFIGSIHHHHPYEYAELGGVRIIF